MKRDRLSGGRGLATSSKKEKKGKRRAKFKRGRAKPTKAKAC